MLEPEKISFDIDGERLKSVLKEVYKGCSDLLNTPFDIPIEEFISKIDKYLDSNRVSIPIQISLPSRKYPELKIDVNLRQRKVFARMASRSKQALVNHFLKVL